MKQVDEKKLAKEIGELCNGQIECDVCAKRIESYAKAAIEAHNPAKENIVRPGDLVKFDGRERIVLSRKAWERGQGYAPNNRIIPVWSGDGSYSYGSPATYTFNGKPVTGYDDD